MPNFFIYGLAEPETGEIRYVGQSTNPTQRLTNHLSDVASTSVREWVRELAGRDIAPMLVTLATVTSAEDADVLEAQFIAQLFRPRLLNRRNVSTVLSIERSPKKRTPKKRSFGPSLGCDLLAHFLVSRRLSQSTAENLFGFSKGLVSRLIKGTRCAGLKVATRLEQEAGIPLAAWRTPQKGAA